MLSRTLTTQLLTIFYITNYFILRNSGKIKSEIRSAATVLNIQHYTLSKLTGTRFVGYRRNAFRRLLDMWPAITLAYENVVADNKTLAKTKAKVSGQLRKFKSYDILCKTCTYLDLLEIKLQLQKSLKGKDCCHVMWIIDETIANIQDAIDDSGTDEEFITSHLSRFSTTDDDGEVEATCIKADCKRRDNNDRERLTITFPDLTNVSDNTRTRASNERKNALESLKELITRRKVCRFFWICFLK